MIAIIGGGCSGVLAAISLLREAPDEDLIVIEPREDLGRGMAYSTPGTSICSMFRPLR